MPIIPLGDDNHHRSNHWLNWTFIIIGIAVMAYTVTVDRNFTLAALEPWMLHSSFDLGFNAESTKRIGASIFMHQNPALLAVYLYMLWMLGDNVEYIMGHFRYFIFFMISSVMALLAQYHWPLDGENLPLIGFGGGAFAVMGAYIACFPKIKVDVLHLNTSLFNFFVEGSISVKWLPAIYMLLCFAAGVWWNYDKIPPVLDFLHWPETRVFAMHFIAFWIGYVFYFFFRDRSIVIDLPLSKRMLDRTGKGYHWDHH